MTLRLPCTLSNVVTAELPRLEHDSSASHQTLKGGQTLNLDVNYSGYPKPKLQWFFNDTALPANADVTTSDVSTNLRVRAVTSDNAGQYKVKISNAAGEKSATFDVLVKGACAR